MKKQIIITLAIGAILGGCTASGTPELVNVNGKTMNTVSYWPTDFPNSNAVWNLKKDYSMHTIFEVSKNSDILSARYSRESYKQRLNTKAKHRPYAPEFTLNNIKPKSCSKGRERTYGLSPVRVCNFSKSEVLKSFQDKKTIVLQENDWVRLEGHIGQVFKVRFPLKIEDPNTLENFLKN